MHLEFLGKAFQLPVLAIFVLGEVLYLALVVAVYKILEYVFGDEAARKVTSYTIGLPIIFIANIANRIWLAVSWPRRYRNRRLLREIFEIKDLDWESQAANQEKVDKVLTTRARWLDSSFKKQQTAYQIEDRKAIQEAAEDVRWHKKYFWSAHNLAKNGFTVLEKYSDYLK